MSPSRNDPRHRKARLGSWNGSLHIVSIVNRIVDLTFTKIYRENDIQPDGGKLEACTLIQLSNVHSTDHWHDVPCASRETSQYICVKKIGTYNVCDCKLYRGWWPGQFLFTFVRLIGFITSRTRIFTMRKICTRRISSWPLYRSQMLSGGQSHVTCVGTVTQWSSWPRLVTIGQCM